MATVNDAFVLRLRDVTVAFGGLVASNSVSYDVEPGQLLAMIGPNGAGKTTVLNAISGIYPTRSGATIVFRDATGREHDLTRLRPHRIATLGIARTLQNLGLFGGLTVLDNLLLGRYHHQRTGVLRGGLFTRGAAREERRQREAVDGIVDLLGLWAVRSEPVTELPYGVQKRVELGRALAMEPRLLLLDEPMAGMNHEEKRVMIAAINEARRTLDLSILLVEHDMGVVMSIADSVVVLDFGKVIAHGTPAEVQKDELVVAAYLGIDSSRLEDITVGDGAL